MLLNSFLNGITYLLLEDMCQKDMEPSLTLHRQPPSTRFRIRQFMQPRRLMCFLLQALSFEYQDYGVKLLAVCLGATDTHFFDGFKTAASRLRMPEDGENHRKALKVERVSVRTVYL